jgi:hypothetical protein
VCGLNPSIEKFECAFFFSGEHITGGVDQVFLDHLESIRSDLADGINRHATGGANAGLNAGLESASGENVVTGSCATEGSVDIEGEGDSISEL